MVGEERYDYSATVLFLEPFNMWIGERPFIKEMEAQYGTLW